MGVGFQTIHSTNFVVAYNEAYNQLSSGESADSDGCGIDIDGNSSNGIIEYNYIHGNAGCGISLQNFSSGPAYQNITLRYNITQANGGNGGLPVFEGGSEISIGSTGGAAMTGINVYNNTSYNNQSSALALIRMRQANVTGYVANNILISGGSTPSLINTGTLNPSTTTFINNDYFGIGQIIWNNTTYASVAAWQSATSQDSSAKTSNPTLTSAGNGTTCTQRAATITTCPTAYTLQGGSPMLSVGLNLTTGPYNLSVGTQDYYGNAIPTGVGTGYNIGAY